MRTELPATGQDVERVERHGDEADGEVGHGKAEQEIVGDGLQLLVDLERDHDHAVAGHRQQTEESGHDGDQHHLRIRVGQLEVVHIRQGAVQRVVVGRRIQISGIEADPVVSGRAARHCAPGGHGTQVGQVLDSGRRSRHGGVRLVAAGE